VLWEFHTAFFPREREGKKEKKEKNKKKKKKRGIKGRRTCNTTQFFSLRERKGGGRRVPDKCLNAYCRLLMKKEREKKREEKKKEEQTSGQGVSYQKKGGRQKKKGKGNDPFVFDSFLHPF